MEEIVQFHVGDVVSCLQKASLIPGGGDSIIFGTVMGSLGALLAFTSREDVDFFSHLEMHMRQEFPPLCGRDHMAFRSAYFPVKVKKYHLKLYLFFLFNGFSFWVFYYLVVPEAGNAQHFSAVCRFLPIIKN